MDQRIRFLDTPDGRIAYATVGEGPPLVFPTGWFTHLELDWHDGALRAFVETLAASHTVVRYDRLGTGLSDRSRPPSTLTLDAEVAVLTALLDELSIDRATLFGISYGGPVALALAARQPERVRRLVLYGTYANGAGVAPAAVKESMAAMVRAHWGLGSRVLTEVFVPDGDAEQARAYADYQRAAADGDTAAQLLELVYSTDVRGEVADVLAPALVIHRKGDRAIPFELGRELAALLPDARFVALDGRWHQPWYGDAAAVLAPVAEFLGVAAPRAAEPQSAVELSPREREVLALVAEGLGDAEIAERLTLSPHTVHRHVANIRAKLGQPSRAAAAAQAARDGLI